MNKYLMIILVVVTVLSGCTESPTDTAGEFMGFIKSGDHLRMQEFLASDTHQMMLLMYGSINDSALKPYYQSGKVSKYALTKIAETDKSVRFKVIVTSPDNVTHTDTMDLIKQNGEWKVSNF